MKDMDVKNKNVIITGAASGLGKELTKQMIEKGCVVAALDINQENLIKLSEEIKSRRLTTYTVDMASQESIKKFTEEYRKEYDVDIIINNAGIIQPFVNVQFLEDETINKVMNVNFFGPLNLIRYLMHDLTKDRKQQYIVNVSSMGGFFPFPGQTIYGASKAALKILTEGLYAELASTNVSVMVVMPGAINTNITKNSNVEVKQTGQTSQMKILEPDEAARQIIKAVEKNKFKLFLGSDSKFLRILYKINSKMAINYINKKMSDLK